jgi:S-adenosylmethionine-diacylglycerol 3-amino-3-carboxypropyl transferase
MEVQEKLFNMVNNPLKYSNCWEDAELLTSYLDIQSDSKVMSIASGGDNSFMLLSKNPKTMVCLDLSEIQLSVTRIKAQAIRHLSHSEYLQLVGFKTCSNREAILEKIKTYLEPADVQLFEANWMENPLVHSGKFEQYFQMFAHRILPWIHKKTTIDQLFASKSEEAQKRFFQKVWNSWRWKLLFRIFFSRYVMGKYGREPEKLKEVKEPVAQTIFNRASRHLASKACQKNYILQYALYGAFVDQLPPYAKEENFLLIKNWLSTNEIQFHHGDLNSALEAYPHCNRFNLSNIFEYMSVGDFEQQVQNIMEFSAPRAQFGYWELLVQRDFSKVGNFERLSVKDSDNGFFYGGLNIFKLVK